MGDTHFRSNVKEQTSGLKVEYTEGDFTRLKIGSNVYIITSTTISTFNNAGITAAATAAAGVSALADLGRGTVFINGSNQTPRSSYVPIVLSCFLVFGY